MQESFASETKETQDDFSLSAAQMEFLLRLHNAAEAADAAENYEFFDEITASDEWKMLFDTMNWDQAWDRYEIMIGHCTDC